MGAFKILQWILTFFKFFVSNVLRPCCCRPNFMQKYGGTRGETWALITGGSDGIGLEIVNQLAAQSFNICIVARNLEKMRKICIDLEANHSIKTKCLVCDFSQHKTIADYRRLVADQVKDLDIAMVFLNAGTLVPGSYESISDTQVETLYRMNLLHGVYLTKALLPK
jgi:uncharacterized protein